MVYIKHNKRGADSTHACCCRFVELVEELSRRGGREQLRVTPIMCGSISGSYAEVLPNPGQWVLALNGFCCGGCLQGLLALRGLRYVGVCIEAAAVAAGTEWLALCGFMQGLQKRLLAAWPGAEVQQKFMGAAELAVLYRATRLNIHPCSYDAYGMTIIEAASQVRL